MRIYAERGMRTLRWLVLILACGMAVFAADANGKWEFVWQTPGGERRSTLTFKQTGERVEALFPDAKEPITGTLKDGKLSLSGRVYSSEADEAADFHMEGALSNDALTGTGGWGEHQLSFTAKRAE